MSQFHVNKEPQLTSEAKQAIRDFVFKLIIPSGIGLTIASFAMGFFINDMAKKQAYVDAYAKAYEEAMKTQSSIVSQSVGRIAEAEVTARFSTKAMNEALSIVEKIKSMESFSKSDAQMNSIATSLASSPEFANRVTSQLDQKIAVTNKWVKNIYSQATQIGMPNHQGANGYWQQSLISSSPSVIQELK